jgi:hypothetical protein
MLSVMLAAFSPPVVALATIAAVAFLIPHSATRCLLRRSCRRGGGGDRVIACPAIPGPAGAATAKHESDGAGASERPAARLSPAQPVTIDRTPRRLEAQDR